MRLSICSCNDSFRHVGPLSVLCPASSCGTHSQRRHGCTCTSIANGGPWRLGVADVQQTYCYHLEGQPCWPSAVCSSIQSHVVLRGACYHHAQLQRRDTALHCFQRFQVSRCSDLISMCSQHRQWLFTHPTCLFKAAVVPDTRVFPYILGRARSEAGCSRQPA